MGKLVFYFDYLSPFSRFAWKELSKLESLTGEKATLLPVPMGVLFNHWGIKGPGEVAPKRDYMLKACLRLAARRGWAFTTPKVHPFNSLYALRLSLKEVAGENQAAVIDTLFKAGWEQGVDMGDPDELQRVLREAGIPAVELYEKSFSREAKEALKANLARAMEAGVFGVPTLMAQGELFWGHDSLGDVADFLQGQDPLDRGLYRRLIGNSGAPQT